MNRRQGMVLAAIVGILAGAPRAVAADPPRVDTEVGRDWSVSFSVGMPELTALRVAHRIGSRWRLSGDLGNLMMIVTGGLHADRLVAARGDKRLFAGLSVSAVWNSGCGYDSCGEPSFNWGVGPRLSGEWTVWRGAWTGLELGALAGRWPDFFDAEVGLMPLVMLTAGYAW